MGDSPPRVEGPELLAHLERFLGPIWMSWTVPGTEEIGKVKVLSFGRGEGSAGVPLATFGLSLHELAAPGTGRKYRLELLGLCADEHLVDQWASTIGDVASKLRDLHRAPLRGDLISLSSPITPESRLIAFYCTSPVFLQREAHAFVDIALVWLLPVTAPEAEYVRQHGWEAFEERLDESDFSITDLARSSIV